MIRLLAILAATAPSLLSILLPAQKYCGWFAYEVASPTPLQAAVWWAAGHAATLLPVVLALLALWVPRWFPPAGAIAAAAASVLSALTLVVPYQTPCGPQHGEWSLTACHVVAVVALLLTRPEQRVPRLRAAIWSGVVLLVLGRALVRNYFLSGEAGCYADLNDMWALAFYRLDTAEGVYAWVAVAAIGAVFAERRAAPFLGLVLLVPALFEPVAWFLSGAAHNCSSALELFGWPYLIAGVLALLSHARLTRQPQ
ncbi:hypothetical protein GCM10009850_059870 [Nonomuraea monospora]|uniref:Integral membrane protein n=1 Tax=Nonomuraea monospora TaxID=568818 RepID=A0ABP5PIP5_9ACTN